MCRVRQQSLTQGESEAQDFPGEHCDQTTWHSRVKRWQDEEIMLLVKRKQRFKYYLGDLYTEYGKERVSDVVNRHHEGRQCLLKDMVLLKTTLGFQPRGFLSETATKTLLLGREVYLGLGE